MGQSETATVKKTNSGSRTIPLHRAEQSVKVDARTLLSRKRESTRAQSHTYTYTPLSLSLSDTSDRCFARSFALFLSLSPRNTTFGVACGERRLGNAAQPRHLRVNIRATARERVTCPARILRSNVQIVRDARRPVCLSIYLPHSFTHSVRPAFLFLQLLVSHSAQECALRTR